MKRNVSLAEISDGRLYKASDMVKADCGGCNGCSRCCHGMGNSIILDPYDVYRMTTGMGKSMQELLAASVELNVVDGVILPNLKMQGTKEACAYLDEEGRCSIHPYRPGICRLFPLGRYYENRGFQYFLQIHECKKQNRTKTKVKKWIDTPDLKQNQEFIAKWHFFLKDLQEKVESSEDEKLRRSAALYVLNQFYVMGYEEGKFYEQFQERMKAAEHLL